jgi:hypothetical protein
MSARKKKNWIKDAIETPGALRRQLGVDKQGNIPIAKLKEAAKKAGKTGKRARLALTLRKFGKDTARGVRGK